MRLRALASLIVLALLAGACGEQPTNPAGATSSVVPAFVTLGLGEHQRFIAPSGVVWSLPGGVDGGYVSASGMYYAPLRAPAVTVIQVVATTGPSSASATVHLKPNPPDSLDCLAEGQGHVGPGGYVYVEELPEAIVRVNPNYPDSAREAGVDGLVIVSAHVCACGEVLETRMIKSIPMLDPAVVTAVRQWIFKPALAAEEPVAVWVAVPMKFSLH